MSQATMQVGCPQCESTIRTPIPAESAVEDPALNEQNRLRGTETACRNCGHELGVYYY